MFWVYILENPVGKLYISHSDDPERRESEHNEVGRSGRGGATCQKAMHTMA